MTGNLRSVRPQNSASLTQPNNALNNFRNKMRKKQKLNQEPRRDNYPVSHPKHGTTTSPASGVSNSNSNSSSTLNSSTTSQGGTTTKNQVLENTPQTWENQKARIQTEWNSNVKKWSASLLPPEALFQLKGTFIRLLKDSKCLRIRKREIELHQHNPFYPKCPATLAIQMDKPQQIFEVDSQHQHINCDVELFVAPKTKLIPVSPVTLDIKLDVQCVEKHSEIDDQDEKQFLLRTSPEKDSHIGAQFQSSTPEEEQLSIINGSSGSKVQAKFHGIQFLKSTGGKPYRLSFSLTVNWFHHNTQKWITETLEVLSDFIYVLTPRTSMGDFATAKTMSERALSGREKALGSDHMQEWKIAAKHVFFSDLSPQTQCSQTPEKTTSPTMIVSPSPNSPSSFTVFLPPTATVSPQTPSSRTKIAFGNTLHFWFLKMTNQCSSLEANPLYERSLWSYEIDYLINEGVLSSQQRSWPENWWPDHSQLQAMWNWGLSLFSHLFIQESFLWYLWLNGVLQFWFPSEFEVFLNESEPSTCIVHFIQPKGTADWKLGVTHLDPMTRRLRTYETPSLDEDSSFFIGFGYHLFQHKTVIQFQKPTGKTVIAPTCGLKRIYDLPTKSLADYQTSLSPSNNMEIST